jgi:uncharacterized protein YfcZ (UPF0381/DUF406 family)
MTYPSVYTVACEDADIFLIVQAETVSAARQAAFAAIQEDEELLAALTEAAKACEKRADYMLEIEKLEPVGTSDVVHTI